MELARGQVGELLIRGPHMMLGYWRKPDETAATLVNGWVRTGHPEAQSSQLVAEIAAAATRVTGIPAKQVLVVIQNSPAHLAIEGGRVLPDPGEEEAWLRDQKAPD